MFTVWGGCFFFHFSFFLSHFRLFLFNVNGVCVQSEMLIRGTGCSISFFLFSSLHLSLSLSSLFLKEERRPAVRKARGLECLVATVSWRDFFFRSEDWASCLAVNFIAPNKLTSFQPCLPSKAVTWSTMSLLELRILLAERVKERHREISLFLCEVSSPQT